MHNLGARQRWAYGRPIIFLPKKIFFYRIEEKRYFLNEYFVSAKTEKKNEKPAFEQIFPIFIN